jgi:hypothetical protein
MKPADAKRKLMLRDHEGDLIESFIIPMKDPKRALLVSAEPEDKDRLLWNETLQEAKRIWQD